MDSIHIDLVGSKISALQIEDDVIKVRFEPAYLMKTMTGSVERTRWWQNGGLVFKAATLDPDAILPELPAECTGGDVGENVYTYRDMIPSPLESRGRAHCDLKFANPDQSIRIQAEAVTLELEGVAKYIEHIRP